MTEKEKMLKQMLYDANYDKELMQDRMDCKDLCYEYNHLRPSQVEEQKEIIRKIVGKTKKNFFICPWYFVFTSYFDINTINQDKLKNYLKSS